MKDRNTIEFFVGMGVGIDWKAFCNERPFDNTYTVCSVRVTSGGMLIKLDDNTEILFQGGLKAIIKNNSRVLVTYELSGNEGMKIMHRKLTSSNENSILLQYCP